LVNTPLGRLVSGTVGRFLVLRSEVNLTEQQRHQIRDVMVSHRAEIAATVKSVREQRLALRKAVLAEKTDEAAIRTAAEGLGKAIGDASVKAAKLRGELAPVLSAEQKELIHKFLAENEAVVSKFLDKVAQGK
jgi:Spy/CpxP family protein refolding chaperone